MANTKVTSRVLANDAVLTANIADDQVTTAKIADDVALGGNPTTTTQSAGNNTTRIATTAFVTTAVANIVDSAPSALDTLNELAAALGDDANFSTTVTNSIATKLPLAGGTMTGNIVMADDTSIGIADDAERIEFDGAGDINILGANLGIGTTSPNSYSGFTTITLDGTSGSLVDLEVNGTVTGEVYADASNGIGIQAVGSRHIQFKTDNTERMRIDSSGDIFAKTADARIGSDIGSVEYGTSTSNSVRFYSADTERMRITSAGNVGIGDASPSAKLDVNSGTTNTMAHFHSTDDNGFIELKDDDTTGYIGVQNDYLYIGGAASTSTQNLVINDGNGNVGIGTTSPSSVLHVASNTPKLTIQDSNGSGNAATPYVLFEDSGGTDLGYVGFGSTGNSTMFVTNYADADLAFLTNSSTRMTIDNSGNVGIGTASPSSLLHMESGNAHNKLSITSTASGSTGYDAVIDLLGSASNSEVQLNMGINGDADREQIKTYQSAMSFRTNNAERMRIASSGNVGIGTTSPAETLHVKRADGTALIVESSNDQNNTGDRINIEFRTDAAQGIAKIIGGKEGNYQSAGARSGYLAFQTINANSYAERMRINSDGEVLIKTTSNPQDASLCVHGAVEGGFAQVLQKASTTASTGQLFLGFMINNGATGSGQINANGTGQAAFGTFSDSRLKENITDLPSQLDKINSMRPVEFDYIESRGGGHQEGFIAQEVEEIYSDMVGEDDNGFKTLTALGKWEARLVKAIQEQQEQIETLKKEVEELKGG